MLGQLIKDAALKIADDYRADGNLNGYNAAMQLARRSGGIKNLSPFSAAVDNHGLLHFASNRVEALSLARNANNSYQ